MKYFSSLVTLLCLVLVGGGMSSCSDDPVVDDPLTRPSAELVVGTVGTNTVELKLTTNLMLEYAYQVTTNMTATAPTAAVLFGTGTKGVPANGTNIINIKGLEGDTEYQVFMATKSESGFGEKIFSEKIRTAKYTELLTFVGSDYFSITFHIEVPAGKVISYGVADRERWAGLKEQMGTLDANYLEGSEPIVTVLKESATVKFEGWWDENWETGEKTLQPVLPGQALVLMCGEVVDGGLDDYDRQFWKVLYDFDKFWGYEEGGDGPGPLSNNTRQGGVVPEDECWTTEYHKTMMVNCKPTDKMPDTHVSVEVVSHTTRDIGMLLTPDPALKGFGWAYMDVSMWESLIEMLGEDGALTWYSMNGMGLETQPVTALVKDLVPGVTYRLIMCGIGNEERTLQSVDYYDFKAKTATKDAPKMVVTGIKNPNGEDSPWTVWFNVKSPSKDVITAKYGCNGIGEWLALINKGMTYSAVVDQQGNAMEQADVDMINSDAGLNMSFPSWEDAETRLVVCGYNDEKTMNLPETDADGWDDMRTIPIPDAPKVESELFTKLVGDWTATVLVFDKKWVDGAETWVPNETPIVTKVIVSAEPTHPTTCPEEVYALYPGKDREWVDELFGKFISSADKYKAKVRGQNRLLCEGLHIGDKYQTPYMSPWDLFMDETYDTYSTDDLFYDFGPKWYLEIAEGDQVSVPVDLATMAPMAGWFYDTFYMVGASDKTYASDLKNFGVTVSSDKQILTVNPVVREDGTFYPSLAKIDAYGATIMVKCQSIVLTKGWTEKPAANVARRSSLKGVSVSATTPINVVKAYHKTHLSKMAPRVASKKVVAKPFSMVDHLTKMVNEAKKANR